MRRIRFNISFLLVIIISFCGCVRSYTNATIQFKRIDVSVKVFIPNGYVAHYSVDSSYYPMMLAEVYTYMNALDTAKRIQVRMSEFAQKYLPSNLNLKHDLLTCEEHLKHNMGIEKRCESVSICGREFIKSRHVGTDKIRIDDLITYCGEENRLIISFHDFNSSVNYVAVNAIVDSVFNSVEIK